MFGTDIAMWLLCGQPLPKRDHRLKISARHILYAKALDNVTVSRAFYPAKYAGYCYICKKNCLTVNCAITRWGTGWARYECWCDEMSWVDSAEFHRREFLTDADDTNYRAGNSAEFWGRPPRNSILTWDEISEKIARKTSASKQNIATVPTLPFAYISTVGDVSGNLSLTIKADEYVNEVPSDEVKQRETIAAYLRDFLFQEVHSIQVTGDEAWFNYCEKRGYIVGPPVGDGLVFKVDICHGCVRARGKWYMFGTFQDMPDIK